MPFRMMTAGIVAALVVFTSNRVSGDDEGKTKRSDRKVLLELYTSQGCDACPPAAALLGELKGLGLGNDQIVPIAFHVDYLNDPWKDPFSAREFSKRQKSYNFVLERDDLYYTPMMMIDGHKSMLGSDRSKALAAIKMHAQSVRVFRSRSSSTGRIAKARSRSRWPRCRRLRSAANCWSESRSRRTRSRPRSGGARTPAKR